MCLLLSAVIGKQALALQQTAALMAPLEQLQMQETSPTTSLRVQVLVICHDA
jgi:hypothetical protein